MHGNFGYAGGNSLQWASHQSLAVQVGNAAHSAANPDEAAATLECHDATRPADIEQSGPTCACMR